MNTTNNSRSVSVLHNALIDVEMTDIEIMSIIDSNPDAVQRPNKDGDYPLHIACRRSRHNQSNSSFRSTTSTAVNSILTADTTCTGRNSIIEQEEADECYDVDVEIEDNEITVSPIIVKKLISLNRRAVMKRSTQDGQHPIKFLFQRKHIITVQ